MKARRPPVLQVATTHVWRVPLANSSLLAIQGLRLEDADADATPTSEGGTSIAGTIAAKALSAADPTGPPPSAGFDDLRSSPP